MKKQSQYLPIIQSIKNYYDSRLWWVLIYLFFPISAEFAPLPFCGLLKVNHQCLRVFSGGGFVLIATFILLHEYFSLAQNYNLLKQFDELYQEKEKIGYQGNIYIIFLVMPMIVFYGYVRFSHIQSIGSAELFEQGYIVWITYASFFILAFACVIALLHESFVMQFWRKRLLLLGKDEYV